MEPQPPLRRGQPGREYASTRSTRLRVRIPPTVPGFQLEELVENEDFAEAAKLKRDIIEATGNDTVAHVMAELKRKDEHLKDKSNHGSLIGEKKATMAVREQREIPVQK
ncbi:unnamed protein product [Miscanthus lutarioriparius]|uniref:Uncharacterized protein n=1 Tax=Miscanthus lutarioriparius TaxID=422564 RepID=A0A811NL33_9POAL|nr:unnamed protein product [Miscanthus lutarioriparius]